jgi:hypothetical protein
LEVGRDEKTSHRRGGPRSYRFVTGRAVKKPSGRRVETRRDGKPVAGESVYIFTPRYFTRVHTLEKSRPPYKDAAKPTTDEIVAAYNTITANAGTYEISGDTFVVNVAIAKNPGNRGVSQQKRPFKVDGKTLTYTETVQGQLHTVKLTRLE